MPNLNPINLNYKGHLLAANPLNPVDSMYKSVILIVSHTDKVAIGLQINQSIKELSLQSVSDSIGLWYEGQDPVWYGGNINNSKIHVIHSTDWSGLSTIQITDDLSVTNDISVLTALSNGEGPEFFRACAGYRTWENGVLDWQLDAGENVTHKWETVPATSELVFNGEGAEQWRKVLSASARRQVGIWF